MKNEQKYELIEESEYPEEIKAMMRQLVLMGEQAEEEAKAFVYAEYGFEGEEAEALFKAGSRLAASQLTDAIVGALSADESIDDDHRRKVISAIFDYAKIIAKQYHHANSATGLAEAIKKLEQRP